MSEKEQWIKAIRNNPAEIIADIIIADTKRIKEQQKEIEKLKKDKRVH